MKRLIFTALWFFPLSMINNIWAQKNDMGFREGITVYGNSQLSPSYEGKYTLQRGSANEFGFYYTRFFKDATSDVTLNLDYTERVKNVISSTDPYNIVHSFYRIQATYHKHYSIAEWLSIGAGIGLYYNGIGDETWQYTDKSRDTIVRESGIDIVGIVVNAPFIIRLRKSDESRKIHMNYLRVNFSVATDIYTSIANSHLRSAGISIAYGFRF